MSKLQLRLTGSPLLLVVWIPIIPMPTTPSASLYSRTVRDDYTSGSPSLLSIRLMRGKNFGRGLSTLMLFEERAMPRRGAARVSSTIWALSSPSALAGLPREGIPVWAWEMKASDPYLVESDLSFPAARQPTAFAPSGCPTCVPIGIGRCVVPLQIG